jgi:predicted unusual protein kinase regulating ubiquinone biosynthesis (AarF/ABC1/UbiB family)
MAERPSKLKVALTVGRLAGRRLFGRTEGPADQHLGEILAAQLDTMKGVAMKLGQIASYMDVPLPVSVQTELTRLQSGIQGMSPAQTHEALRRALGEDYASRFETLDLKPIAAASIGQVHRARAGDRDIALKVRYPNAAQDLAKDIAPLRTLASFASLSSAVDGQALVQELMERFSQECDYLSEAKQQTFFRQAYSGFENIMIAQVIPDFSTESTLASEWLHGRTLAGVLDNPQEVRNAYARTLFHFAYHSLFALRTIQADPHPGNYLFGPGLSVGFLDFGCVRQFDANWIAQLLAMIRSIERDDRHAFRESTIALGMAPAPDRFDFHHHFRMMQHLHRPLIARHFEFTPDFVRAGLAFNGPTSPNARQMAMPAPYLWIARLQWGLWSVLTRLHAKVDLHTIFEEICASHSELVENRSKSGENIDATCTQ